MTPRPTGSLITLIFLMAGVCASLAGAQVTQAELRGTVVDESGGTLPGVAISATNIETGASRTIITSETGAYLMPALPIEIGRAHV